MEKLYGFKEKDIIGLAEYIKYRGERSLSETFSDYAKSSGKAKGTVRNLYYALAKRTNTDRELCERYFNGKPLSVSKIVCFESQDEKSLVKRVLIGKQNGKSVRSVIMEMAGGDGKLALRYQNKFRNAVKNNSDLINQVISEINGDAEKLLTPYGKNKKNDQTIVYSKLFEKLKMLITEIVEKSLIKTSRENALLREKIDRLERENLRLNRLLYRSSDPKNILQMICEKHEGSMLN